MKVVLFCLCVLSVYAQEFDLLLQGGRVIDPRNRVDAVRDVAVRDRRIAAVAPSIAASRAKKTVNLSGLYVVPGLVDIHVHVFAGGGEVDSYAGDNSVYPDGFAFRSSVTTVVDAGSAGRRNFADFKLRIIDRAKTRVLAFVNIVGSGMRGDPIEQKLEDMEPGPTAAFAQRYPGTIVGIKTAHYRGPEWTPVERAVEAGRIAKLPVMVDFGQFDPNRPYSDLVLKKLRPGDISTHMYLDRVPLLDDAGQVRSYLPEARRRGVLFDVGHGGGSFVFRHAVPAVRQDWMPDTISTDLHIGSMNGGMKDMLNVMSKFLNMGMPLADIVLRSTWNSARTIRREDLGHLSTGAPADIAVLRVREGDFGFVDVLGAGMKGTRLIEAELTVRDGRVVWDRNGITRESWDKLGKYKAQGDPAWDATVSDSVRSRK